MKYPHKVFPAFLLAAVAAGAQAEYQANEKEPGFFPSLSVNLNHEDNVLRSDNNTQADSYYQIKPLIDWKMLFGKHQLDLLYRGDYARYNKVTGQDFDGHLLATALNLDLSERLDFDLVANYQKGRNLPGSAGSSIIVNEDVSLWTDKTVQGKLIYGRRIANAQFGLSLKGYERRYTNNGREGRDIDTVQAVINFNLRLAPKTWLVTELRHQKTDYIRTQFISEDSTETNFFMGAEWEATAKTSGKILMGYIKKKPDSNFFDTYTGFGMEADVTWKPKEYSVVTVAAGRSPQEGSNNLNSFYVADKLSIRWQHGLTELVAFQLGASIEKDEYQSFKREEKYTQMGAQLTYMWKRTIEAGLQFNHIQRDSTIVNNDYRTNTFGLFVKWTPRRPSQS
jgi:hypothetical protein